MRKVIKNPALLKFWRFMTAAFQEQLSLLHELQDIDLNLRKLQDALDELPQQIRELESAWIIVRDELEAARAELSGVEKSKRTDEVELAASVEQLRQREARLYAIKTNKEYQAALKEISEGKRINREREDRILQAMEQIEALTQKITQLEKESADKEVAFKSRQETTREQEGKVREKMGADTSRRPALVAAIDKMLVRKYDFVRQRYPVVLSAVVNGICQGCSRKIPPQLFNEMLRREELKACPSCQRLIYVAEAPAEVKE